MKFSSWLAALTAKTTPVDADVLILLDSEAAGVPKKITKANLIAASLANPMTTEGDLIIGGTSGAPNRLEAGTNGYVLTANGAGAAPAWEVAVGGGLTLIAEQSPSGSNTVTFSSIPGTYRALMIQFVARSTASSTSDGLSMQINEDTTATNYRSQYELSYTNTATAGQTDSGFLGNISANSAPGNSSGSGVINIVEYAGTVFNKMATSEVMARVETSGQFIHKISSAVEWENNAAITRLDFIISGNFVAGSKFRLYGLP